MGSYGDPFLGCFCEVDLFGACCHALPQMGVGTQRWLVGGLGGVGCRGRRRDDVRGQGSREGVRGAGRTQGKLREAILQVSNEAAKDPREVCTV